MEAAKYMVMRQFLYASFVTILLLAFLISAEATELVPLTNAWRFNQTQNLNGTNWFAPGYSDAAWSGPGAALLYSESNTAIAPRNTPLTLGRTTYYFRTMFNFAGSTTNMVLTFSNKVDDGAVFYLNGSEIQRVRMPAGQITYTNFATDSPMDGDATGWDVFSVPATNLVQGSNLIAVEVHQTSATSSDIVFGSAVSMGPVEISRGPYLQLGTPHSIVLRWRTQLPTDSIVRFGTNLASLTEQILEPTVTTEHQVTIGNLSPDTVYFYTVAHSAGTFHTASTNRFFQTAPLPGSTKPTRIWVIGDAGTKNQDQADVRDAYYTFTGSRHTDLWLMLGDNAYETGEDSDYQAAVFDVYNALLQKSVVWPALGNHDTGHSTTFSDVYPYFSIFSLPTNGSAGGMPSGSEHYYSFDHGNIHFVCLDSMTANRATNAAMANWLRADLASSTYTWLIAFWHHPPYTKGSHNSDTETVLKQMRQNFLPMLEDAGVDLVLTGHSHSYERSMLIDRHYDTSDTLTSNNILNASSGAATNAAGPYTKWASGNQAHQGAVYAVVGSSGKTEGGTLDHPAMFISLNQLGSMVLDITENRLEAKFLRETNLVDDTFVIVKEDPALLLPTVVGNSLQLLTTNVAAGKTNILQVANTLSNWIPIHTNVSTSNQMEFTDQGINTNAQRFYRIQRLP